MLFSIIRDNSILFIFFAVAIFSCKKDDVVKTTATNNNTGSYPIYYTGTPIIGDTVFFVINSPILPDSTTYLWDFGDSTTSTSAAPYHIYNSAGDFHVTLSINNIPDYPDIPDRPGKYDLIVSIYKDPIYTPHMTNLRSWHIVREYYPPADTTYGDTSFALKYVNDVSVFFNSEFFTYNPTLSSNDVIVFSAPGDDNNIYYNYVKDSVVIHELFNGPGPDTPPISEIVEWRSP